MSVYICNSNGSLAKCASWAFARYVLRARNGNLRNGNARNGNRNLRIGNGVSYVMSLPYGDGEPREGGGGGRETRTIYMCGQTGYYSLLVHAHTLATRSTYEARTGYS